MSTFPRALLLVFALVGSRILLELLLSSFAMGLGIDDPHVEIVLPSTFPLGLIFAFRIRTGSRVLLSDLFQAPKAEFFNKSF